MSSQNKPEPKEDKISETVVEEYLQAHPDFFERHTNLLTVLRLPHPSGGAVSLMERQVTVLREKNRQLERKLMDLVQVARDNERLSTRLHHLALGLMEADGLDAVVATTQEQLRNEFKADHVVIRLFSHSSNAKQSIHFVGTDEKQIAVFDALFENKRPFCGRLTAKQLEYLFAGRAAEVASAVMVPLYDTDRLGIIALGSHEETRFHPGMGTLFLGYLGELISRAVSPHRPPE